MRIGSHSSPGLDWGSNGTAAVQKAAAPSPDMSAQERDILTQERALRASAVGATARTTYIYATGADGVRYIVGAQVTITGPEEVVDGVRGGEKSAADSSPKPLGETADSAQGEPQKELIAELERTQREVVAHEAAHKTAAGRFGGPIRYTYTTGPDGKRYVTGGEVSISTPATSDPMEALRNARQVMRAAMAPGDPSGQDISVASSAAAVIASASAELARGGSSDHAPKPQQLDAYTKLSSPKGLWLARGEGENTEAVRQTFEIAA